MAAELLRAIALVLVIEGLMPFVAPKRWRETLLRLAAVDPRHLRLFGAALMVAGAISLQFIH